MASNGVVGNQPKRPVLDNFQKPKLQKASENTGTFAVDGLNQVNNTSEYYNETESENNSKIRGRHSIQIDSGDEDEDMSFRQGGRHQYSYGAGGQNGYPALGSLQLGDTGQSMNDFGVMSCELGSHGLKVARENFEIGTSGMKNMKTGEVIVGNLVEEDLELGEILGNGASGYVYAAVHKPTGRKVALKRINVFDKGKRHQLINDLRSLSKHDCPFLIQFFGAMFDEGSVKVALELMNIGSLKDVVTLAKKDPQWNETSQKPCVPEPVAAKMMQ